MSRLSKKEEVGPRLAGLRTVWRLSQAVARLNRPFTRTVDHWVVLTSPPRWPSVRSTSWLFRPASSARLCATGGRGWAQETSGGVFSRGRKAHGLRRQEVAQLSGVSVDYLTQLEQGRAKAPSPQVLTALSRALRLSSVERLHLFFLAGQSSQDSARRHQAVPDSLRRMVRQLPGNPAAIYDPGWSPIIWNSMWATISGGPKERPERERNKVWPYLPRLPTRVLRSPEEERLFEKRIISDLRSSFGQYPDDEQLGQLISDLLAASPRFCELWKAREVAPYDEEHKTIEHPELGLLQLHCDIVRHEGLRVVVFTAPAGSSSAKALIAAQSLALDQHALSASEAGRPAHRLLRPAV